MAFVDAWGRVLGLDAWDNFYREIPHAPVEVLTLPLIVLLLAGLFWAVASFAIHWGENGSQPSLGFPFSS